jgi:hypothetical protein
MRKSLVILSIASALGTAAVLGACGSSTDKSGGTSNSTTSTPAGAAQTISIQRTTPTGPPYHPKIDPAKFSTRFTNRYWPLKPGATWTYDGTKDGQPEHVVITVTNQPRTVFGVRCVTVVDTVTINGSLEEKTTDWYAQDNTGAVWYFGEDSKDYKNGVVSSTQGTWEAGVDGALPGVIIQGKPKPGPTYRQEYRPGVAEDKARVLTVNATQKVPAGSFHHVVQTYDTDPLNPDKREEKFFAPGIGPVHTVRVGGSHHEEIKLISFKRG